MSINLYIDPGNKNVLQIAGRSGTCPGAQFSGDIKVRIMDMADISSTSASWETIKATELICRQWSPI